MTHRDPPLAPSTQRVYASFWNSHVLPFLGEYRLDQLSPDVIENWRLDMRRAKTGRVAMGRSITLLNSALARAVEWQRLDSNPAQFVRKPPQSREREIVLFSPAMIETMRGYMTEMLRHRDAMMILLLGYAGLRPGEARALTWRHSTDKITVEQRITDSGLSKSTKTGKDRKVRLLAPLAQDLAEWRERTRYPNASDYVFPDPEGSFLDRSAWINWYRRIWPKAAGIEGSRPYDLRHSFASLLLQERTGDVVYVATQLGQTPTTCLSVYAHVIEELEESPMSAEQAIWEARAVPQTYQKDAESVRGGS